MGLNEVTIRSANLFVTKGNVAKTVQLKEIIHMGINPKERNIENLLSTTRTDGNDLDEIEEFYDDIEFDDGSEVDYGLEYTQSH